MKLLGGIISGIGIFIVGTSGICSLELAILAFARGFPNIDAIHLTIGAFSGIPFGVALIYSGRTMVANANRMAEQQINQSNVETQSAVPNRDVNSTDQPHAAGPTDPPANSHRS